MGEHECLLAGCVGKKFDGSSFTCNRCLRPFFYDCLETRSEVKYLMGMISTVNTKTPMKMITKIKLIFNSESIFETICPKCKSNGSFTEHINQWKESTENEYKRNIDESIAESDRLNKKCENLELINANLNQKIIDLETDKTDIHMDSMRNDVESPQNDDMYNKIKSDITVAMNEMEQRFQNQIDEMKKNMGEQLSPKRVVLNPNNEMKTTPKTSRVNNILLRPPDNIEKESSEDIYMIHLSRFHINTTEKDIKKHIMNNTNITNAETFRVNKLVSQKEENRKNYVSFKITTLNRDDYDKIMNENIWLPDFRSRDYYDKNMEKRSNKILNTPDKRYKNKNKGDIRKTPLRRNRNNSEMN